MQATMDAFAQARVHPNRLSDRQLAAAYYHDDGVNYVDQSLEESWVARGNVEDGRIQASGAGRTQQDSGQVRNSRQISKMSSFRQKYYERMNMSGVASKDQEVDVTSMTKTSAANASGKFQASSQKRVRKLRGKPQQAMTETIASDPGDAKSYSQGRVHFQRDATEGFSSNQDTSALTPVPKPYNSSVVS